MRMPWTVAMHDHVAILGRPGGWPPPVPGPRHPGEQVAILGRPGGWPPPVQLAGIAYRSCTSCDPRPPRRVAATGQRTDRTRRPILEVAILGRPGGWPPPGSAWTCRGRGAVAILGRPGGWPPRSVRAHRQAAEQLRSSAAPEGGRHLAAAPHDRVAARRLRSSAAPEGGRHSADRRFIRVLDQGLRSSAAPEDGRHAASAAVVAEQLDVAILGRPEVAATAARVTHASPMPGLRSSAVPEGGRHRPATGPRVRPIRPVAILGRPERMAATVAGWLVIHAMELLRSSAAPRVAATSPSSASARTSCCDPRPPQRMAATRPGHRDDASWRLRSSAAPEDGRHHGERPRPVRCHRVAILGRPRGWPPRAGTAGIALGKCGCGFGGSKADKAPSFLLRNLQPRVWALEVPKPSSEDMGGAVGRYLGGAERSDGVESSGGQAVDADAVEVWVDDAAGAVERA